MKIALVCDRWDHRGGGLELWAWQFAAAMGRRKHSLHVVTFDARSEANGVTLHPIERLQGKRGQSKLARAEAIEAALGGLGADVVHDTGVGWNYDVIHPHSGSKIANHHANMDSRPALDRRLRQLRPSHWKWRREVRELERRQYERSDGLVIAVSNKVAGDLRRLYQVRDERIRVVPNAVDTERFSPERRAAMREDVRRCFGFGEETVFLFSALNPVLKGAYPLLRAMRRLPHCRLLMVGSEAPVDCGTVAGVTFGGYVDDPMIALAAADAVVQPTYYDACSLTTLEGWACGLPVVTTRFNGASELMEDGAEGFLLDDPDNDRELARVMEALTNRALREPMSNAARTLALSNTYEHYIDRIEATYRSVR